MKHLKKFESSEDPIILKDSIGEIIIDYINILSTGDLELAKRYLKVWTGGDIKMVWDGKKYVPSLVFTLNRFGYDSGPRSDYWKKRGIDVIELTTKLLKEI